MKVVESICIFWILQKRYHDRQAFLVIFIDMNDLVRSQHSLVDEFSAGVLVYGFL